jgi:aspartyl-tRNA(Asn)/glutamyl-tRNA(Gln) amidotransferase subunit B
MDQGSMRADVNVSVRRPGNPWHAYRDQERQLGPLRHAGDRVRGEPSGRRARGGGKIVQETRLFDPDSGTTRSMRSKEDARLSLFPDPTCCRSN